MSKELGFLYTQKWLYIKEKWMNFVLTHLETSSIVTFLWRVLAHVSTRSNERCHYQLACSIPPVYVSVDLATNTFAKYKHQRLVHIYIPRIYVHRGLDERRCPIGGPFVSRSD